MAICVEQRYFSGARKCFITAVFGILLTACSSTSVPEIDSKKGVMYQPISADIQLDDEDWQEIIDKLKRYGIRRIYVQWTRHNAVEFREADNWLMRRLQELDRSFELVIGLYADSEYFNYINETADLAYFERYLAANKRWFKQFASLRKRYPLEVEGYYFPGELNDQAMSNADFMKVQTKALADWQAEIGEPLFISSFYTGVKPVQIYLSQIEMLHQAGLKVLHQDGLGTQVVSKQKILVVLAALPNEVSIIREIFLQSDGEFKPLPPQELHRLLEKSDQRSVFFSLRYLN